jgi:hypothetical protein
MPARGWRRVAGGYEEDEQAEAEVMRRSHFGAASDQAGENEMDEKREIGGAGEMPRRGRTGLPLHY